MAKAVAEVITPSDLDGLPDGTTYKRATPAQLTKVDGVEDNATADQTGAEIKTAYEAETGAYNSTKDTKLTGIEEGATADQTGAEIQTAIEGLADADRKIMVSEPLIGEYKIYGIHRNAAGNIEYDYETVAE